MSTRWVSLKGISVKPGIDTGTGGVDQALRREAFGQFQEIEEPLQVGLLVGKGIDQGVPHPGLGRQMADFLGPVGAEEGFQGRQVRQVRGHADKIGVPGEFPVPVMLQGRGVIIVEVVQPHHPGPVIQQGPGHMIADEPGAAGHQERMVLDFRDSDPS